jgi:hypothetical protein
MNSDMKKIYLAVLNEIEKRETNLSIAGGRGYGTGKAYSNKSVGVLQLLGYEENELPEEYKIKPVKISKAFKDKEKK